MFSALRPEEVRWTPWSGVGLQQVDIRRCGDGWQVQGACVAEESLAAFFRLDINADWTVTALSIERTDGQTVNLRHDGSGQWSDASGAMMPALEGCIDPDLSMSPFTNTLPLLRLPWEVGQSRDLRMAYVSLETLKPVADGQRYTLLSPTSFRYEALDGAFAATVSVDAHGLVTDYPPLFRRSIAMT